MNLYDPGTIRHLKDKYGFRLNKGLGQNFLIDPAPLRAIVEGSRVTEEDLVIEIGPGIGVLTAEIAQAAGHVTAIEVDRNLEPILAETLADYDNIDIVYANVLDVELDELIDEKRKEYGITGRTRIVGNLPYYITTPIVMKLLEKRVGADSITIMTQKEVADRMTAGPGGKEYGSLSVVVQYRCRAEKIANVSRGSFYPNPKVDSAVVNIEMLDDRPVEVESEKDFFACVRAGFGQRRKTLLNALSAGLGMPKEKIREILTVAGIDPTRRAETLSIEEFAGISDVITRGR